MLNALTYLTRKCPRACDYCAIRDAKDVGPQLTAEQWILALKILEDLGVDFNLILGNETWLLGANLVEIMTHNKVPYALYTTCPEPLFSQHRDSVFKVVDNLSCGVDWPLSYLEKKDELIEDSERKSLDAWRGFHWGKSNHPEMDTHGTITLHRKNLRFLPEIIDGLSDWGVFSAVNFLHWNSDGNFDFFPKKEELSDFAFPDDPEFVDMAKDVFAKVLERPGLLQNPEILTAPVEKMMSMGWHCNGDPYGGPTIDADGTLRLCGYRKGKETPKFTIFDLPRNLGAWREAVKTDAIDCPGCAWSYPWLYHYYQSIGDTTLGQAVFNRHAGKHIPKEKWARRRLEEHGKA